MYSHPFSCTSVHSPSCTFPLFPPCIPVPIFHFLNLSSLISLSSFHLLSPFSSYLCHCLITFPPPFLLTSFFLLTSIHLPSFPVSSLLHLLVHNFFPPVFVPFSYHSSFLSLVPIILSSIFFLISSSLMSSALPSIPLPPSPPAVSVLPS